MIFHLRRAASWRNAAVALVLLAIVSPYAHASAHANHHDSRHCELCVVAVTGAVPSPPAALPAVHACAVAGFQLVRPIPPGPTPAGPAAPRGPPSG